jgi:hypothetical protein
LIHKCIYDINISLYIFVVVIVRGQVGAPERSFHKSSGLSALFRPPLDLLFEGTFEQAIDEANRTKR